MKYTYPFGNSPAANKLETLLKDNSSARRKISRLLSKYSAQLLKVAIIRDPETVRLCMEMLRDYNLQRMDIKVKMSDEIRSYTKNLIMARHRSFRRCFDDLVPVLEKIDTVQKNNLTSGEKRV